MRQFYDLHPYRWINSLNDQSLETMRYTEEILPSKGLIDKILKLFAAFNDHYDWYCFIW